MNVERAQLLNISQVDWADKHEVLQLIRYVVFVVEQNVPIEEEWDGMDESSTHFLASDTSGLPIGTARLMPTGQIGRMAVLQPLRGSGVGSKILQKVVQHAKQLAFDRIFLHAQTHAIEFYERHGFVVQGEEFMDAGIPHREMVLEHST